MSDEELHKLIAEDAAALGLEVTVKRTAVPTFSDEIAISR
jgi:hypothetical protein